MRPHANVSEQRCLGATSRRAVWTIELGQCPISVLNLCRSIVQLTCLKIGRKRRSNGAYGGGLISNAQRAEQHPNNKGSDMSGIEMAAHTCQVKQHAAPMQSYSPFQTGIQYIRADPRNSRSGRRGKLAVKMVLIIG